MLAYFALHGELQLIYWTFFQYPARIVMEATLRLNALYNGIFFIDSFVPLIHYRTYFQPPLAGVKPTGMGSPSL
jgi:hypothetical protein